MRKGMKKMRRNREGKCSINTIINDGDDILCEILSRIPAKSLMRFKCVCKRWQSLIQHNSYFIDLHFNRSKTRPRLFLANFVRPGTRFSGYNLMLADMFDDKAVAQTRLNSLGPSYDILGPINGFVCFFHMDSFAVRIYNLSTRQTTAWIKKEMKKQELEVENGVEVHHENSTYRFGFDPATKEHKVIFLCRMRKIETSPKGKLISDVVVCEVLTVGQNSWRRIDEVPPFDFQAVYVYANGSIYWRKVKQSEMHEIDPSAEEPALLVAFDVGSEKFRIIPVPDFILNQPPKCDVIFGHCSDLLEVDGCLALLHRISGYTVKLWIFEDSRKKGKITTCNNWIEETITLPFYWERFFYLSFKAVAGTDQLIIICKGMREYFSLYSYDRKKKTSKEIDVKIEISGMSVRNLRLCPKIKPFVENLLSVQ